MFQWIAILGKTVMEVEAPKLEWKRPLPITRRVAIYRPVVTQLEKRELLACSQSGAPPWCRDLQFDLDGQTEGDIPLRFEEARAMIIQQVDIDTGTGVVLQDRPLLAGHAIGAIGTPHGSNSALLRLCPNGKLDNGINCEGNGFGIMGVNGKRLGYQVIDFFDVNSPQDDFEEEIITALAIQPDQHSDVCDTRFPQ